MGISIRGPAIEEDEIELYKKKNKLVKVRFHFISHRSDCSENARRSLHIQPKAASSTCCWSFGWLSKDTNPQLNGELVDSRMLTCASLTGIGVFTGPDAGYGFTGNGSVPQPTIYMGRQNGNQGNAEFNMGAQSKVPATVLSNSLGMTKPRVLSSPGSTHMGNTNLTGNSLNKHIPRHNPITGETTHY